jgi:hypothetical protein
VRSVGDNRVRCNFYNGSVGKIEYDILRAGSKYGYNTRKKQTKRFAILFSNPNGRIIIKKLVEKI